ncbi:MAG: protein-L-isoaspartate(D-aspartate) O-methyltransferase [Dehalococcoidia bacterium]|nr:protein-L-isoaspartate(D-aspartate) O-methyltransferase [Dehalococcoidia bacterium]MDW8120327.1 protein-L-isoaspartate(D-aspartate) O-methyltransferase [Chloroflexota bacterium]
MEHTGDLEEAKERLFALLRRERQAEGLDERVIQAMERVPRERFVPPALRHLAYEDIPLPIGWGQTISQPFIVCLMTSALDLQPTDKVLEIGTGSGYQAAVLAELVPRGKVITVERVPHLLHSARAILEALGYGNRVEVRPAGEVLGCPEEAPFHAILVTAGAPTLPRVLLEQLAIGGRMVIPIGSRYEQDLMRVVRTREGYSLRTLGACRFVPLIGKGAWEEDDQITETPHL